MKLQERGVRPESDIYVFNPSLVKKDYFYQMLCIGHYYCSRGYSIAPNTLDSYLLLFVEDGSMYTITKERETEVLKAGQLAILNCYDRPSYGCKDKVEFYWIHFDSHDIDQLYNEIRHKTVTAADRNAVRRYFFKLIEPFERDGQPSEAAVNKYITNILTEFFEPESENVDTVPGRRFEYVCNYISNHLGQKISNDEMASMANMSAYHFIRSFKKEIGCTPHEFLLRSRVNTAMFLLRATDLSLTEITYKCGFANEAAFSNTFKALAGITPLKCRKDAKDSVKTREKLASTDLIAKSDDDI